MNKNTPFRTKYTNRPEFLGEQNFSASITQPDLAYSVRELVDGYAIGALPSMAQLQPWIHDSYDEDDTSQDLGFGADKAGMLEKFLEANSLRRDIFDRVQKRYNKMLQDNPNATSKEATTFDGVDLSEIE